MKIEIYVAGHKASSIIPGQTFIPIHVGKALSASSFGAIGDDTGDNISNKNPTFCELTALYWIWKNTSGQDYVGLFHYRRHLDLSIVEREENEWGVLEYDRLDEKYLDNHNLSDEGAKFFTAGYDAILPKKWSVKNAGSASLRDHYDRGEAQFVEDYDSAIRLLKLKYPSYAPFANKVNAGHSAHWTNMFILRRSIFDQYCQWLFDILLELEPTLSLDTYNVQEARVFGYISEWLFNIWLEKYIADNPDIKIREARRTFIRDTTPPIALEPRSRDAVAIAMSFNDAFAPYGGAAIRSILDHSSADRQYELFVFQADISDINKQRLQTTLADYPNFSLRFIDANWLFDHSSLRTHMHFSRDIYYRLSIPELFEKFEKVVYLDADTIVLRDIAELADVDLHGKAIGAVRDVVMVGFQKFKIKAPTVSGSLEAGRYLATGLGMKDVSSYFQSGVLVFDKRALTTEVTDRIRKQLGEDRHLWFPDQDILNVVFEGDVHHIDMRWNVLHGNGNVQTFYENLPVAERQAYFQARRDPFIVHYAGERKPWLSPSIDYAEHFWSALRKTPWYEHVLITNPGERVIEYHHQELGIRDILRAMANPFAPLHSKRRNTLKKFYRIARKPFV